MLDNNISITILGDKCIVMKKNYYDNLRRIDKFLVGKRIKKILSLEKEKRGKNVRLMILGNLVKGNT